MDMGGEERNEVDSRIWSEQLEVALDEMGKLSGTS